MIEPGRPAPPFTLKNQDGARVSLADYRGRTLVLAFYPGDFSPVCTDQLNVYQEVLGELRSRGVELVGISVDSAFCHKAFQRQLGIEIELLADFHPKGETARAYGVFSDEYGTSGRALVMVGPDSDVLWSHESPALEVPGPNLIFDALSGLERAA